MTKKTKETVIEKIKTLMNEASKLSDNSMEMSYEEITLVEEKWDYEFPFSDEELEKINQHFLNLS